MTAAERSLPEVSGFASRRVVVAIIGILLVFSLGLKLGVAFGRSFQVDEIEHLHAAYSIHEGKMPYRDFMQGHTPLLHFILVPLISPDNPVRSYLLARGVMTLVSVLTVFFVFKLASETFAPAVGALAALFLSFHTTFTERSIEVRPDPWLAFFSVVVLFLELHESWSPRRSIVSGFTLGIAALFTQKALFICFVIGTIWLARAIHRRAITPLIIPITAFLVPIGLSLAFFASQGILMLFVDRTFLYPLTVFSGGEIQKYTSSFPPDDFIRHEAARNVVFTVAAVVGMVLLPLSTILTSRRRWERLWLSFASIILLISLWANPYPYPYYHVAVLPLLAVFAGWSVRSIWSAFSTVSWTLRATAAFVVALFALQNAVPRLASKVFDPSRPYQFWMLSMVQRVTERDDAVFDLVGLHFRPHPYYYYTMPIVMLHRYRGGRYPPMIPALRNSETTAVMSNYRTSFLPEQELSFIRERFVHYTGNLFVLGTRFSLRRNQTTRFEALKTKHFTYDGPSGAITIDGRPFQEGVLGRGWHTITASEDISGGLLILKSATAPATVEPPRSMYVNFD